MSYAEGDRHALVDDIRKMAGLIEQSDKKIVEKKLNSSTTVSFKSVAKDTVKTFKIGNNTYRYTRLMF